MSAKMWIYIQVKGKGAFATSGLMTTSSPLPADRARISTGRIKRRRGGGAASVLPRDDGQVFSWAPPRSTVSFFIGPSWLAWQRLCGQGHGGVSDASRQHRSSGRIGNGELLVTVVIRTQKQKGP